MGKGSGVRPCGWACDLSKPAHNRDLQLLEYHPFTGLGATQRDFL